MAKTGPTRPLAEASPTKPSRSILADLGGRSTEGVVGASFLWDHEEAGYPNSMHGGFTFSLKNELREPVRDVYCLVVFFSSDGQPVDVSIVRYTETIPQNLARRVNGRVDGSTQRLTTDRYATKPKSRIEFRILDFKIDN